MSSQLTCGSKRVAKMLASRLRFTERKPLPWPFPVTHVFFLGRAPVDFTRDGCVVFCRRRTTVVHSVVVGAQTDVDDAQTDVNFRRRLFLVFVFALVLRTCCLKLHVRSSVTLCSLDESNRFVSLPGYALGGYTSSRWTFRQEPTLVSVQRVENHSSGW